MSRYADTVPVLEIIKDSGRHIKVYRNGKIAGVNGATVINRVDHFLVRAKREGDLDGWNRAQSAVRRLKISRKKKVKNPGTDGGITLA